jgi:hypothetical protein
MYGESRLYGNWETDLITKNLNVNLTKSIEHQNEVMVRWQKLDWHVPSMINVWTKYGEPKLYGNWETYLITKTLLC